MSERIAESSDYVTARRSTIILTSIVVFLKESSIIGTINILGLGVSFNKDKTLYYLEAFLVFSIINIITKFMALRSVKNKGEADLYESVPLIIILIFCIYAIKK